MKSILTQDTDLLGNKKKYFMLTKSEMIENNLKENFQEYYDNDLKRYTNIVNTAIKNFNKLKKQAESQTDTNKFEKIKSKAKIEYDLWHEYKNKIDNLKEQIKKDIISQTSQDYSQWIFRATKPLSINKNNYSNFELSISSGEMTVNDAITIIKNAGLQVPQKILDLKESKINIKSLIKQIIKTETKKMK